MTQRVDISQWYTRKQSDIRYVRAPEPANPPASVTLDATGVISAGQEFYAYLDLEITPPSTPAWANVDQYVQGYDVAYSYVVNSVTVSNTVYFPYSATNIYRLTGIPTGATVTVSVATIDYVGQRSATTAGASPDAADDSVAPAQPTISVGALSSGAGILVTSTNTEADFAYYEVWRSDGGAYSKLFTFNGSYTIDGSIPTTGDYSYKVRAVDLSGNYAESTAAGPITLQTTGFSPPPAVSLTGATATPNTDGSVTLSWHPVVDSLLAYYEVWRKRRISTGPDVWEDQYALIHTFAAASGTPDPVTYTDADVISGQRYRWTITAINSVADRSAFSGTYLEAASADTSAPTAVATITISGRVGGVLASWTPSISSDVVQYKVNWRLSVAAGWQAQPTYVAGTNLSILGLTSSRDDLANQLEVSVTAVDEIGNEQLTATTYVATYPDLAGYRPADSTVPAAPASLTATQPTPRDGSVTLSWPASTSVDRSGYQVEQWDSVLNGWVVQTVLQNDASGTITHKVNGLEAYQFRERQYKFRIRTLDYSGNISAINLVRDPSFELGGGGWSGSWVLKTSNARSGTQCLQGNYTGSPNQRVTVSANLAYTFSAYFREDPNSTGGSARISLSWLKGDLSSTGSTSNSTLLAGTSSYQRLSVTATSPSDAAYAVITLAADSSNPSKTVYWDDIQLEQGVNANFYSDASTDLINVADATPPADYSMSLTATGALGSIRLRWVNPASTEFDYVESKFEIWRSTTSGGIYAKIDEVPGTNDEAPNGYDDLEPDEAVATTYYYKIKARDRFGNVSGFLNSGNYVTATSTVTNYILDTTAPPQPTLVGVTANDDGSLTLTWNGITTSGAVDLAGYVIWRKKHTGGTWEKLTTLQAAPLGSPGTVTFTDIGVVLGVEYDYSVSAFDRQENQSAYDSTGVSGTSGDVRVPQPATALVAKAGRGQVVCSWTASTTVLIERYEFQYTLDNGGSWSTAEIITGTTKIVFFSNAENLAQFLFRVRAVARSGGAYSSYATVTGGNVNLTDYQKVDTTAPNPISGLSAAAEASGAVLLTWTDSTSTDAKMVRIFRKNSNEAGYTFAMDVPQGQQTARIYGLEAYAVRGATYTFQLYAVDNSDLISTAVTSSSVQVALDTTAPAAPSAVGVITVATRNLLLQTEAFDQSPWADNTSGIAGPTITANTGETTDPLSGNTAEKIVFPATGANEFTGRNQNMSTRWLGGVAYHTLTASVYLKAGSATTITLLLQEASSPWNSASTTCNVTTSWQRFTVTKTFPGSAPSTNAVFILRNLENQSSKTIYAWGAQLEYGDTMTAYEAIGSANTTGLTLSQDGTTIANLTPVWPQNTEGDLDSYSVRYYVQNTTTYRYVTVPKGSSKVTLHSLLCGVNYMFDVAAKDINGNLSAYSTAYGPVNITNALAPSAPTLSGAGTALGVKLTLTYSAPADFDHFDIYHNTVNNSGTATVLVRTPTYVYIDRSMSPNDTKYFWVKAVNRSGQASSFSNGVGATCEAIDFDGEVWDGVTFIKPTANQVAGAGNAYTVFNLSNSAPLNGQGSTIPVSQTGNVFSIGGGLGGAEAYVYLSIPTAFYGYRPDGTNFAVSNSATQYAQPSDPGATNTTNGTAGSPRTYYYRVGYLASSGLIHGISPAAGPITVPANKCLSINALSSPGAGYVGWVAFVNTTNTTYLVQSPATNGIAFGSAWTQFSNGGLDISNGSLASSVLDQAAGYVKFNGNYSTTYHAYPYWDGSAVQYADLFGVGALAATGYSLMYLDGRTPLSSVGIYYTTPNSGGTGGGGGGGGCPRLGTPIHPIKHFATGYSDPWSHWVRLTLACHNPKSEDVEDWPLEAVPLSPVYVDKGTGLAEYVSGKTLEDLDEAEMTSWRREMKDVRPGDRVLVTLDGVTPSFSEAVTVEGFVLDDFVHRVEMSEGHLYHARRVIKHNTKIFNG